MTTLLVVGSAGLAVAQVPQLFPRQPNDVSFEYYEHSIYPDIDDKNGLPVSNNLRASLILDSKARAYAGQNVYVNENFGPLLFPAGDGKRERSIILPGLVNFHAWYGEFTDMDGDRSIDQSGDAFDEWNGYTDNKLNAPRYTPGGMLGYVRPGFYPSGTSDYYILGDALIPDQLGGPNETALESLPDFEYRHLGDGNWTGSFLIPMAMGSLVETITIHTTANCNRAPTTTLGYSCTDADDVRSRVDIDRYDVLNGLVSTLFSIGISTKQTLEYGYLNPAFQPAADVINAVGSDAITATLNFNRTEHDRSDPYASMTTAYGVRSPYPDRYDYSSGPHAWLDVQPWNYYTEPNFVGTLAVAPAGVTDVTSRHARGLAPHFFGIQGDVGIWYDRNGDGSQGGPFNAGEFQGTCAVLDTAGEQVTLSATVEPVTVNPDGSVSTGSWNPGVYIFREDNAGDDIETPVATVDILWWDEAAADLADNLHPDRFVTGSTPITITLRCDDSDPGDWFANEVFYLPAGTFDFALKISTPRNLFVSFVGLDGSPRAEEIVDIDLYEQWN